ncbi:hypothetical protein [Domibacillus indicus]|uniref:hypothetical protein n=1 Tax=Domibacillus indicus TaxID=1437523 RepID=UPI000617E049|nr:hypothetical protein [Domibacillus indicus]
METKILSQFYEKNLEEVTKIVIIDGNTGYSKTITDKTIIESFLDDIKDIKFIPDENQEDRSGFNYGIAFYWDEEVTFSFSLTRIGDHYYHTAPDIYPIVDSFYLNLPGEEK